MANCPENATDLQAAIAPTDVPMILRNAALLYHQSAAELESSWQDVGAGKPWTAIASQFETLADEIEKANA